MTASTGSEISLTFTVILILGAMKNIFHNVDSIYYKRGLVASSTVVNSDLSVIVYNGYCCAKYFLFVDTTCDDLCDNLQSDNLFLAL